MTTSHSDPRMAVLIPATSGTELEGLVTNFQLSQALLQSNNPSEARVYLDKLVADFPEGRYAEEARKTLDEVGGGLDLDVRNAP